MYKNFALQVAIQLDKEKECFFMYDLDKEGNILKNTKGILSELDEDYLQELRKFYNLTEQHCSVVPILNNKDI